MKATDQPSPEDTPYAPREDRVATEPATVQRCAEDYQQGAGDRNAMDMNARHQAARR